MKNENRIYTKDFNFLANIYLNLNTLLIVFFSSNYLDFFFDFINKSPDLNISFITFFNLVYLNYFASLANASLNIKVFFMIFLDLSFLNFFIA